MRHAAWVLAYHGCDRKVGESILSGKEEIRVSSNRYDWLGTGAYFWENSFSRADHWAKYLKQNPGASNAKIEEPFVIGAIINPGNCLDLMDDESLNILKAAYPYFEASFEFAGTPMPKNESSHSKDTDLVKRKLDCAVINFLHQLRAQAKELPFDSVRSPFMEGEALFAGSKVQSKTHMQWCVRQPEKSILGYFRPRKLKIK